MLDFLLFSESRVSSGNYFIYLQTYLEKEKKFHSEITFKWGKKMVLPITKISVWNNQYSFCHCCVAWLEPSKIPGLTTGPLRLCLSLPSPLTATISREWYWLSSENNAAWALYAFVCGFTRVLLMKGNTNFKYRKLNSRICTKWFNFSILWVILLNPEDTLLVRTKPYLGAMVLCCPLSSVLPPAPASTLFVYKPCSLGSWVYDPRWVVLVP